MAIIVNGVNIPNSGDFVFSNNVTIDKVVANGVVVWERLRDVDVLNGLISGTIPYAKYEGPDRICTENEDGDEYCFNVAHHPTANSPASFVIVGENNTLHFGHVDLASDTWDNYLEFSYDLTPFNYLEFSGTKRADTSVGGSTWAHWAVLINGVRKSQEYSTSSEDDEAGGDFAETAFTGSINVSSYSGVCVIRIWHDFWSLGQGTNSSADFWINELKLLS